MTLCSYRSNGPSFFQIPRDVTIYDKPAYPYRGILLDTARNYYSIESIMATIGKSSSYNSTAFISLAFGTIKRIF